MTSGGNPEPRKRPRHQRSRHSTTLHSLTLVAPSPIGQCNGPSKLNDRTVRVLRTNRRSRSFRATSSHLYHRGAEKTLLGGPLQREPVALCQAWTEGTRHLPATRRLLPVALAAFLIAACSGLDDGSDTDGPTSPVTRDTSSPATGGTAGPSISTTTEPEVGGDWEGTFQLTETREMPKPPPTQFPNQKVDRTCTVSGELTLHLDQEGSNVTVSRSGSSEEGGCERAGNVRGSGSLTAEGAAIAFDSFELFTCKLVAFTAMVTENTFTADVVGEEALSPACRLESGHLQLSRTA
jgi:hypothetical protein